MLAVLVLASMVPGIMGTAALIANDYRDRREQLDANLISTARAMAQSVDSQLVRTRAAAEVIASFGGIDKDDLPAFHRWARQVLTDSGLGLNVVLANREGQQVLNTLTEFGEPLPRHGNPLAVQNVFETGQSAISDLYIAGYLQVPAIVISVPVLRDEQIIYALTIGMLPDEFNPVLEAQNFPPDWVATILDNSGTIVARTHSPELFVGQRGSEDYVSRFFDLAIEGSSDSLSREGIPLSLVWSRSPVSHWTVGIGIPTVILERELQMRMIWLAAAAAVLLSISLAAAWQVGKRIADSVRALKEPALAMGSGEILPEAYVMVEEVAQVAKAIHQAAKLLERRQFDLEAAQQINLQQLEDQVAARTQDLVAANRKLEQLALTDDLTGVHNRKAANARLRQEFLRFRRSGHGYAILFLDVDHFKSVNDSGGHEAGDQALQQTALLLKLAVRESDLIARYGGEEFLALLQDTDLAGAETLAEKIRYTMAAHVFPLVDQITISIGVSVVRDEDYSEEDAVRRADNALYRAKNDGRNLVRSE